MVERKPYQALIGSGYASPRVGVIRSQYQTRSAVGDILTPFVDKVTREAARKQALADKNEALISATNTDFKIATFGVTIENQAGLGNRSDLKKFKSLIPFELRKPTSEANIAYNRVMLGRFDREATNNMQSAIGEIAAVSGNNIEILDRNLKRYWEELRNSTVKAPGLESYGDYRNPNSPLKASFDRLVANARNRLISNDTENKVTTAGIEALEEYKKLFFNRGNVNPKDIATARQTARSLNIRESQIRSVEDEVRVSEFKTTIVDLMQGESIADNQKILSWLIKNRDSLARDLDVSTQELGRQTVEISKLLTSQINQINNQAKELKVRMTNSLTPLYRQSAALMGEKDHKEALKGYNELQTGVQRFITAINNRLQSGNYEGTDLVVLQNNLQKVTQFLSSVQRDKTIRESKYVEGVTLAASTFTAEMKTRTTLTRELAVETAEMMLTIRDLVGKIGEDPLISDKNKRLAQTKLGQMSASLRSLLTSRPKSETYTNTLKMMGTYTSSNDARKAVEDQIVFQEGFNTDPERLNPRSGSLNPSLQSSEYQPSKFAETINKYKALPTAFVRHTVELSGKIANGTAKPEEMNYISDVIAQFKKAGIVEGSQGRWSYGNLKQMGFDDNLIASVELYDDFKLSQSATLDNNEASREALKNFFIYNEKSQKEIDAGQVSNEKLNNGVATIFTKHFELDDDDWQSFVPAAIQTRAFNIFKRHLTFNKNYELAAVNAAKELSHLVGLSKYNWDQGADLTKEKSYAVRPLEMVIETYTHNDNKDESVKAVDDYIKTFNPKWKLGETHRLSYDARNRDYFLVKVKIAASDDSLVGMVPVETDQSNQIIKINLLKILEPIHKNLPEEKRKQLEEAKKREIRFRSQVPDSGTGRWSFDYMRTGQTPDANQPR
tara:strand:- start:13893 stop:16589 length:2697 start_codon:yes stop_codon:yes gene_type:complete